MAASASNKEKGVMTVWPTSWATSAECLRPRSNGKALPRPDSRRGRPARYTSFSMTPNLTPSSMPPWTRRPLLPSTSTSCTTSSTGRRPSGPVRNPTVEFEIKFGRFQTPPGSRMVVTFLCDQQTVVVDGFDNGVPFSGRPGDQLAIEGNCGFGPSPNPSGDPSFDVRFNADHARFELEVPLTRNLGGGDRLDGVYDPSPAFWSAFARGSGTLVLSQNTLSIDINTGGTTVTPLQPQAQTSPLVLKKGEMRLERDRDEDEHEDEHKDEREDRLSLRGSFV